MYGHVFGLLSQNCIKGCESRVRIGGDSGALEKGNLEKGVGAKSVAMFTTEPYLEPTSKLRYVISGKLYR